MSNQQLNNTDGCGCTKQIAKLKKEVAELKNEVQELKKQIALLRKVMKWTI